MKIKKLVLLVAVLFTFTVCFAGCSGSSSNDSTSKNPNNSVLNKTITLEGLEITPIAIEHNYGNNFKTPSEGNVFIGVKFSVKNISTESTFITSSLSFKTYVNDVEYAESWDTYSLYPEEGGLEETAPGNIKEMWYSAEIPADWNTLELIYTPNIFYGESASFIFKNQDIPVKTMENNSSSTLVNIPINKTEILDEATITVRAIEQSYGYKKSVPDDGNVFVLVEMDIKNTTSEELSITQMLSFRVYADGTEYMYSQKALQTHHFPSENLQDDVAPGETLHGYFAVEIPENWKELNVIFCPTMVESNSVIFSFNNDFINR